MTATAASHVVLVRNVRVPLGQRDADAIAIASRHLGIRPGRVLGAEVIQRNLDARRGRPTFVLQLRVSLDRPYQPRRGGLAPEVVPAPKPALLPPPAATGPAEVAVVGAGPAGLFAAERLCRAGLSPVILERGPGFPGRHQAVADLQHTGRLDPEANFHFGLGGAGTYSDGKLYTRLQQAHVRHVLETLQRHGGGSRDQILVDAHPHVGTDRWPATLTTMKAQLEDLGCRFRFGARVTGLRLAQGRLIGLSLADGGHDCQAAILSPGNSARDLFAALLGAGLTLSPKSFAVGVRMTHPQALIDHIQYGRDAGHPNLDPAAYRLRGTYGGRGVYSFCMCPGGTVVPTPTEPDGLALNGMSNSARDSGEANAAVVVAVDEADFGSDHPLAGVEFQRRLEQAAYTAGGGGFVAPAQRLVDFLAGRPSQLLPDCRYGPGVRSANLSPLLPEKVAHALGQGLSAFCRKMRGLEHEASVLLGFETRTSSPVRIARDPDFMAPGAVGLFPAGEGAGYAGGIASSAADGIRAADALIAYLNGPAGRTA